MTFQGGSDRSDRIRDLFDEVVGLAPEERTAHLAEACGDDEDLRRDVESLLEAEDARGSGVRRALEGLQPSEEADGKSAAPSGPGQIPAALQAALADRYSIVREIGRGGMATVYLADDLKLPRQVAIKVLNPELSEALGADRFLLEIETASSLTHPHILPLHDSGEADGLLYYVMPYVKGESLRDRLKREKQLPVEDAVRIAREVADALAYAHGRGVVHRDVKPANILLEAGHAVLADFGVAKAVAAMDRTQLTQTGTTLGTPTYMSPEQASGDQQLDGRSDQYALGCVLYEMLAGEPPFRGARVEAVVRQHLTVEPAPVTQARPTAPESVAAALHRALAKNPADRFRTTRELGAALAEGPRPPVPPVEPPGPSVRKMALIGASVLVALVGAWAAWSIFGAGGSGPEGDRPLVAVLPFENLSPDSASSFFAGGVQLELRSTLTRVPTIEVIGSSSVEHYGPPGSRPPLSQIARELGVDYLIGAGARLWGDSVRITVQLMDRTGVQVWAEDFDGPYTPEGYVRAQAEIVQAVAYELRAVLSPDDEEWLQEVPTRSLEAFEAYLRGNDEKPGMANTRAWSDMPAIQWYEKAVELDADFALAMAQLARLAWQTRNDSDGWRERALGFARRALALEPDLVDARVGLFLALPNGDERTAQLDTLRRIAPDDPEILRLLGRVQRGAGDLDAAIELFRRAVPLDPLDPGAHQNLTTIHVFRHQYDEALRWNERWMALSGSGGPGIVGTYIYLARGDTLRARAGIDWMLRESPRAFYGGDAFQYLLRLPERLLGREEREMLLGPGPSGRPPSLGRLTNVAIHETAMGRTDAARAAWQALRTYLDSRERPLREYLALAYMGLDDREAALELAGWWEDQISAEDRGEATAEPPQGQVGEGWDCRTFMNSLTFCPILARIYTHFGLHDRAIDLLEEMLPAPSWLTVHILEVDPIWDPLRENPRFQALLEEYADDVEH
jgi:serine/threonine-protein kinase